MLWQCIKLHQRGIIFYLKIIPNQKFNKFVGVMASNQPTIKLAIKKPPTKQQANLEVISFFAEYCNVSKSTIILLKGTTTKQKTILLTLNNNIENTRNKIISKISKELNES
ncbi:DUF167 domain-containing protein [Rickettsiales bacterium LUAb2]